MSYTETLQYLYAQLPLFSRVGAAAYKKDLTNTIQLCEALGNPQLRFKTVHVAGTNGKGSTSHMLAAIFQEAGYKTGLYTSPHLVDFRERIRINGEMCTKEFVVDFTNRVKPLIEEIEPSFFELTVAMAFTWFAEQEVDIAIIETGMGGRLDSTNIITPELSVITNIGFDHMQMLGNTLPEIAQEKAGIIKQGTPVIIGEYLPETRPVFEAKATAQKSPIIFASDTWRVNNWHYDHHELEVQIEHLPTQEQMSIRTDLPGIYQLHNLLTVVAAARQLQEQGWHCEPAVVQRALQQVKAITGLHGRWELIAKEPPLILDVGHNEDGIRAVLEQLALTTYSQLHIVTGMVKDKDFTKVLSLLPSKAHYYFTQAHIPRALEAITLQQEAAKQGLQGDVYTDVNAAITAAQQQAHSDDLILVCGSVFLVGEVDRERFGNLR